MLVIDLPPGTGDVQLTLAQQIPISGGLIVTTPQDVALADVRRGIEMFAEMHAPVLGIVENMSLHVCSECGHESTPFGQGGGERLARELGIELLARLPLLLRPGGCPVAQTDPKAGGMGNHLQSRQAG